MFGFFDNDEEREDICKTCGSEMRPHRHDDSDPWYSCDYCDEQRKKKRKLEEEKKSCNIHGFKYMRWFKHPRWDGHETWECAECRNSFW